MSAYDPPAWTVSFPEPESFNGQDDTTLLGRADGRTGPTRSQLKQSLYMAVRLYGAQTVRDCLEEVLKEMP